MKKILVSDPYVAVLLNGFLTTPDAITMQCSDAFSTEFRDSYQSIIDRVNDAISKRQMCVDSGGTLNVFAGQIQFSFVGNNVSCLNTIIMYVEDRLLLLLLLMAGFSTSI